MRWYTPIECDNTVSDPLVTESADLKGFSPDQLRNGTRLEAWDPSASFSVTRPEFDGHPDDVLQDHIGSLPVYSARLKRAIEELGGTDIQFLPVTINKYSGESIGGLFVANILSVISAVDWHDSIHTRYPEDYRIESRRGKVRDLKKPVLLSGAVAGHDVIRLLEFPLYICVSGRFRDAFERTNCTGYSFRELLVKCSPTEQ